MAAPAALMNISEEWRPVRAELRVYELYCSDLGHFISSRWLRPLFLFSGYGRVLIRFTPICVISYRNYFQ